MWHLDHEESCAPKNWRFWTVVLEKTLESALDCKEIQPVHPKGNQSWLFIGRTDADAPILWPPDVKKWVIRKDPDAGKDWRQEEKGMTEDKLVGWHHWLDGHEFEQAPGVGDGQGSLVSMGSQTVRHDWATEVNWMWNLSCSMWDLILWPGIEPTPPALRAGSLLVAIGPPGSPQAFS